MNRVSTHQGIMWFLNLERTGQLDLNPTYQRKSVWSHKDRRLFLDTIFRNYPCPSIFLNETIDEDGQPTYHVVDGKQRLDTIIQFSKNDINTDKNFGDVNLNGKQFKELPLEYKRRFWSYRIPVETIDVTDSTDDMFQRLSRISINDVFDRLNRVSKTLNKQELRHALHNGWFMLEAQSEAESEFWKTIRFTSKTKSRRMLDVQFISELLIILIEKRITGFSQGHISDVYEKYDNLSALSDPFDTDEFASEKERLKDYISLMVEHCPNITEWIKKQVHLYILWALLALPDGKLPSPTKLASKYQIFMKKVDSMTDQTLPKDLRGQARQAYAYYLNSTGASADLAPRTERLNALRSILDV